jgi:hypothetical protein
MPRLAGRFMLMKPAFLVLLIGISLLQWRCNRDNPVTLFDLVYVLPFSMPAALNTVQTHFVEFIKVPTRYESLLAEHGLTPEQVGRIEPHSAVLEVVLTPENLSYFREIFVEFLDGSNRLECFYTPNVPFNAGSQVLLVGTIADFLPLLSQSAMNLRVGFRLREPSPSAMNFNLRLTYKAKA